MNLLKRLLLCLFFSFLSAQAAAQFRFDSWTTDDGLPQNSIFTIQQTRDGYLWMGTFDGLARFDGVNFKVFDNTNTPGLKNNWVKSVAEDAAGNVWVGTDGSGLFRRSGEELLRDPKSEKLPSQRIMILFAGGAGDLWIGTQKGLSRLGANGELKNFTVRDGLPSEFISSLAEDDAGAMWIGTNKGLARFKDGKFTTFKQSDGLTNDTVTYLKWSDRDGIWIGTEKGLNLWRDDRFAEFGAKSATAGYWIMSLTADSAGVLWIGTYNKGLWRLKNDGAMSELKAVESLTDERVLAIYQDSEENLWVGAATTGLYRLKGGRFQTFWRSEGLQEDYVTAVYEDRASNLWLSTDKSLYRLNGGVLKAQPQPTRGDFYAFAEDNDGNLWMGSFADRGKVWRLKNGQYTSLTTADGLPNSRVSALICDRAGGVWVGTGGGLAVFRDGRFTVYKTGDGLTGDVINALYQSRDDSIWIGTPNGVSRWRNGQITGWTTANGLSSNLVLSFYEAEDGAMWIGTENGGLNRYKNGEFVSISTRNGLYDNLVYQILEAEGDLWMSSYKGIYRASLRELNDFADGRVPAVNSYSYGTSDGMISRECNGSSQAGWKTADGNLWFPTVKGLVKIDMTKRNLQPPRVLIEKAQVDDKILPIDENVEITPEQENLEIKYTAISWTRPRQISFKYRIEGLDRDWIEAGTRRTAYFSHLPAGEYTFQVIADNGDGVWNTEGKSLRITVLPPFYRTWWFSLLLILAVSAAAYSIYKYRIGVLEKRNEQQKMFSRQIIRSQEQERSRIAANLHDSLGQQLLVIKNWAMMELAMNSGKNQSHEALDEISGTASQAIDEVREIIYDLRPYQLDKIGLTKTLLYMIEKVSAAADIEFEIGIDEIDDLFDYDSEVTFYRIVQECLNNILKHSEASKARVIIKKYESKLSLLIEDDGRGFVTESVSTLSKSGGFGLTGIGERVRMLGGTQAIVSAPGSGTKIIVSIALSQKNK